MGRKTQRVWRLSRAAKSMPEPASVVARSQAAVAAASSLSYFALVTTSGKQGSRHYVITPDRPGADKVAFSIAQSVASRADETDPDDLPDLAATRYAGVLTARRSSAGARDSQSGADPGEAARRVQAALHDADAATEDVAAWVAVVARPAKSGERRRVHTWYAHRLGSRSFTHHVKEPNVVVCQIFAGGSSRDEVKQRLSQIAAAMPGFDVDTRPIVLTDRLAAAAPAVIAAAGVAADVYLAQPTWTAAAIGAAGAAATTAIATGITPTAKRRAARRLRAVRFARPPHKTLPPHKPRTEGTDRRGRTVKDSPGSYPLDPATFLVAPHVLVGCVAPHGSAASGSTVTEHRQATAAMLDPAIGMVIGRAGDGDGSDVYLPCDATASVSGLVAVGRQGSGKSQLVRSIFAWNCLERVRPSGRPDFPGRSNALVAFESKGAEGAAEYMRWARVTGDRKVVLMEVADPATPAIDVFSIPGTLEQKTRAAMRMMVYAFGADAIQGRSAEAITVALAGGMVVDAGIAAAASLPSGQSPIFYAYVLLGGHGGDQARALASAISDAATVAARDGGQRAADLAWADNRLQPFYGPGTTASSARNLTEAARNKVMVLAAATWWWDPARPRYSWADMLTRFGGVVINTGVTTAGTLVDAEVTRIMSAMLMFSLRDAIERTCGSWRSQNKFVTVFSDELALLAPAGPEVVTWLHDQGRSYGVRPVFATQRLSQLDRRLQESLSDFGTVCWFQQASTDVAEAAARDLSADGATWQAADVVSLEKFTAVVRTHVDGVRQTAVPVRLEYFEANPAGFPVRQGYELTGSAGGGVR